MRHETKAVVESHSGTGTADAVRTSTRGDGARGEAKIERDPARVAVQGGHLGHAQGSVRVRRTAVLSLRRQPDSPMRGSEESVPAWIPAVRTRKKVPDAQVSGQ